MRSSGRTRLPTWVTEIRSLLSMRERRAFGCALTPFWEMCKLPHPRRRRRRRGAMHFFKSIPPTRWATVGLACALASATLAACGGSNNGSSTSTGAAQQSSTSTSTKPAGSATGGAGKGSVTNYQAYVGGKAGKADPSKSPVYIGWVNQQGGQQEIGGAATDGADLAVKVVNEQLGGIDGHPVVLKKCFIKNAEEEGTTCGQKLGNDKSVRAIALGGIAIGIQPFYSTIGGRKPVVVGVAATPVDTVQKNSIVLFGDATHVLAPFGTYARDVLHAKSAAIVYPTIAGITTGAAALAKGLTDAGVKVKKVGYAASQTDLIGPLTAAGPNATSSAVLDKLKAFKGPVALGAPELSCGKYGNAPAVCNDRTQFFTYEGGNNFVKAAPWWPARSACWRRRSRSWTRSRCRCSWCPRWRRRCLRG